MILHLFRRPPLPRVSACTPAAPDVAGDRGVTRVEWLICTVAGLGFAFDLYESLMTALIVGPSLTSLGHLTPGTADFNLWVGLFFFAAGGDWRDLRPAGWLSDRHLRASARAGLEHSSLQRLGRRRCDATSLTTLLLLRCATLAGVCVEAVAAVAWIAELFPVPARREKILGFTQACYPVGGILVSGAHYLAVTYGDLLPEIRGSHDAWRYTLLSGLIPAFPLIVLRPFLPESPLAVAARGRRCTSTMWASCFARPAWQDRGDRARRRVHAGDSLCRSPTHAAYRARHCQTRGHVPA